MKHLDFGLKLWSTNTDLISAAIKLIDEKIFNYIELLVVPGTQISPFMIDVPYIIHIPHHKFGLNIGDARIKKYNLLKITECMAWADELDAKYMILHAGDGSMEHAGDLLYELKDRRLLIENMPKVGLDDEMMIGYTPEQIEELMGKNGSGLCLDFGHAIKAAKSLSLDYKDFIKSFLVFEPRVFHISDGTLDYEKDEHLNIGQGEYEFPFLLGCINKNSSRLVTLEIPRMNQRSLREDIDNVMRLKDQMT